MTFISGQGFRTNCPDRSTSLLKPLSTYKWCCDSSTTTVQSREALRELGVLEARTGPTEANLGDSSFWGEVVDVTNDCVTYPVAHWWLSLGGIHRCSSFIPLEYCRNPKKCTRRTAWQRNTLLRIWRISFKGSWEVVFCIWFFFAEGRDIWYCIPSG